MELNATIEALFFINNKFIFEKFPIKITTDSKYVQKGITDWIKIWKKNGWKTSNKKPVLNQDLWMKLDHISKHLKIQWNWTKAHNGDKFNEIVDKLAKSAAYIAQSDSKNIKSKEKHTYF
jgi:ribonuclease HI